MKQKDIALVLVVAIVSGMISFFAGRLLFASPKDRQVKAEIVDVIQTDFTQPSTKHFNSESVNLTRLIQIGDNSNTTPFSGR